MAEYKILTMKEVKELRDHNSPPMINYEENKCCTRYDAMHGYSTNPDGSYTIMKDYNCDTAPSSSDNVLIYAYSRVIPGRE